MRTYCIAQGTYSVLCGDLNGKKIEKRGGICICIVDSLCCIVETDKKLLSNYMPIKINFKISAKANNPKCQPEDLATWLFLVLVGKCKLINIFFTLGVGGAMENCKDASSVLYGSNSSISVGPFLQFLSALRPCIEIWASQVALMVKNPPAMQETWV